MPDTVVRGVTTAADTYFYQDGSTSPLIVAGGVTYQIFAPNNLLVDSGAANQDSGNAAHWTINFTIPKTAPITSADQRYTLKWRAATDNGSIYSTQEYFKLVDPVSPDAVDTAVITLAGAPFNANLLVAENTLSTLSLRVLNADGVPVISLGNLVGSGASPPGPISPVAAGDSYVYSVPVNDPTWLAPLVIRNSGLTAYFSYFNYTGAAGNQETEVQPLYIINAIMLNMMHDVRQFVDMLRNNDAVVELRITEIKLAQFVIQGLLRLNACPPANFTFDFNTLGQYQQFYFYALKCAQYELLSALYLAEGMTAFDLQGMSVQLTSDRSQYIQTLMSDIRTDLDNNMPKAKSQYARSGGFRGRIGTIGMVLGPASNWVFRASVGSANFGGALPVLPFLV